MRISTTISLIMANPVAVSIVICASLQDYFVNAYKQVFFTPSEDHYFFMEEYGQSIMGLNTFVFDVRACSNVHILLMKDRDDFDNDVYEIVIGENGNNQSILRKGRQNDSVAIVNHRPLDCRKLKRFWFSWENSTIKVGTISAMTLTVFLSFTEENLPPVHFFSISTRNGSTGHWVFDSNDFNNECCSYEAADCQDILDRHYRESGVYSVTPVGTHTSFHVYCDMENDPGGWLVFQRRLDGSEDFYRNWENYTNGFGNPLHEFWLGNDHLHAIVSQGWYTLRIMLEDLDGNKRFANYAQFKIKGPAENYKLTIGGYFGDAGDSLSFHQGAAFSTYDRDNDFASNQNCAERYDGAWWYSSCHHSNLNGLYLNGSHTSVANGVNWKDWLGHQYSLKATEMKIRRK